MTSGIYQIINLVNNKSYIGSSIHIEKRFINHLSLLKKNKHYNSFLQSSFNKYGESSFILLVLEEEEDEYRLVSREQYYINKIKPEYNLTKKVRFIKRSQKPVYSVDIFNCVYISKNVREASHKRNISTTSIYKSINNNIMVKGVKFFRI